jgi:predicted metal-dependent peptidase
MEREEFDFCPPDKRMLYSNLIMPSEVIEGGNELNDALIILDVSGSVDREELLSQIWQISSLLNELDFRGSIISFGSSVYQEARLTDKASLRKFIDELEAGGGTNWHDVVEFIRQKKRRAKPLIVYTDGYFFSFEEAPTDAIFITRNNPPAELHKLGKVIQINK